mmetsp:Transcript_19152/g.60939  ORF Transcript_19152/g.60939 Transcript_19152/m.60939 type:complete len:271 (+) Transcript_19152:204-1016(+)
MRLGERVRDIEPLRGRLTRQRAHTHVLWVRREQLLERRGRVEVEVDVLRLIHLVVGARVRAVVVEHRQVALDGESSGGARAETDLGREGEGPRASKPPRVVGRRVRRHAVVHPASACELVGDGVERHRCDEPLQQAVRHLAELRAARVGAVRVQHAHEGLVLARERAPPSHVGGHRLLESARQPQLEQVAPRVPPRDRDGEVERRGAAGRREGMVHRPARQVEQVSRLELDTREGRAEVGGCEVGRGVARQHVLRPRRGVQRPPLLALDL